MVSRLARTWVLGLAFLAIVFTTGCSGMHYVTQAAAGQEDLNRRGISIEEIVTGKHLDRPTRELLAHVARIKAFGEARGLRKTKNYTRYIYLNRPAVLWVVTACEPLRFRPKTWSFPVVGSITYTGWFDRAEADTYAKELAAQGWDVDVRPSQAYSTLGWFDDPILSTMIDTGPAGVGDLADVVLHETLHATFYIPGQSTLNESVASFFGHHLALQYLDEIEGPDSPGKAAFEAQRIRGEKRSQQMKEAYFALEKLYASRAPDAERLVEKKRITTDLRAKLSLKRDVTNATLIQYKTYGSGQKELEELLGKCGGSFPRMLEALERVRPVARQSPPHTDPALLLKPILAEGC